MRTGLLCVLLCWILPALAAPPSPQQLAAHPRWQALLHINPGATLRDRQRSYVDDDKFFLADSGKDDVLAELQATLSALQPAASEARCRFPARYRFLAGQLGWQDAAPFGHCAKYKEWRQAIHANRAVLVFPAAYLNSPSSMFGHTLLRLDQGEGSAVWLNWAVNYGAVSTGADNSLFYIYRGLAGGYPGRFALVPYVEKIQEYSHMENRDIWEYTLDLNQQEIDWMIDHLWELKDVNFDYYFFDENCSFRLLELVEVARPGSNLLSDWRFAEIPVNTVRGLDQGGFITERQFRPSKAVELNNLRQQLSHRQQRLARRLADDPAVAESEAFQLQSREDQAVMAAVAYRYLRLVHRKEARDPQVAKNSFALLTLMNQLPSVAIPETRDAQPPEEGHGTQMLALAGGQRQEEGGQELDFAELSYRLTYHDLLDNPYGFLRGAQLKGLNMTLRSTDSGVVKLEQLDLVSIRSLAPRNRFIKPLSWYVEGAAERDRAGSEKLISFVQGGAGGSWLLGNWQPYLLTSVRMENNVDFKNFLTLGAGLDGGLLYRRGNWQWQLGSAGHYFSNDEYRYRSEFAVQWAFARQQGLRASVQRVDWRDGDDDEFKLQWQWYFD